MNQLSFVRDPPPAPLGRIRFAVLLLLALSAVAAPGRAVTVEAIPNPRPTGWTVDLTGSLSAGTIAELNRIAEDVESRTGAQMAVVVVGSTDGADPRDFATRLFNSWGIGQADRNDGVLIFAALDDRAAEIILGDGFPATDGEGTAEAIMQSEMVPRFRDGDVAGALLGGAQACARRLLTTNPPAAAVPPAYDSAPAPQPMVGYEYEPAPARSSGPRWILPLVLLGGMLGVCVWAALTMRQWNCPQCKNRLVQLGEAEDDAHLTPAEITEDRIGSVDHAIWTCLTCGHVAKRSHGRWFSGYSACPACQTQAFGSRSTTLQEATYSHGGLVRVDRDCAHCGHHDSSTRSTPRLERVEHRRRTSSLSSGSSSRGGSSSGGGSRSRSFGGGRSSGRGASGRW